MQFNVLSESTLEELYEKVILPQFGISSDVSWEEHLIIGPDNVAHVFVHGGRRAALVFDDYPATDEQSLIHEFPYSAVTRIARDSTVANVNVDDRAPHDSGDEYLLRFGPSDLPFKHVHNVTGYFQLFLIERFDGARL